MKWTVFLVNCALCVNEIIVVFEVFIRSGCERDGVLT